MGVFAPDTSVMIPTLIAGHPHHTRAVVALGTRLDAGETMVIIGHTLLETYSSLTRMPLPSRVVPNIAWTAIRDTFLKDAHVVSLSSVQYVQLLSELVAQDALGGQVYDAAIIACARQAGVTELLTFNERHFRRVESDGLTVTVP